MIKENDSRRKELFGSHDQVTGEGMPFHDHICVIPDYQIPKQWLTEEVYLNGLYQEVMQCGSIGNFIDKVEKENGFRLEREEVTRLLFVTRLARDPSFAFISIHKIKDKRSGRMIPFRLNYAQRKCLEAIESMRLDPETTDNGLICLKARQWGGSTFFDQYIAWKHLFVVEGLYAVIIAQTKDTARRIRAMYEKCLENIPGWVFSVDKLQFSPYKGSGADVIITDGKKNIVRDCVTTIASYENSEATRGMDYAMAHYSEVAYWRTTPTKSAESVITNIDNNLLIDKNTIEIFESTANGQSGYFYDEYQLAKQGKSSRRAIFVPFFWIENDMLDFKDGRHKRAFCAELIANKDNTVAPSETEESGQYLYSLWQKGATLEHIYWYTIKRKSFHDHGAMAQEVPSDDIECFVYSGSNVFSAYTVSILKETYSKPPLKHGELWHNYSKGTIVLRERGDGALAVWQEPDKTPTNHQYLVICDLGGRSEKSDPSCITVINRLPKLFGGKPEVVARWHGHLRYDAVANTAVMIAKYYKNALLVFESNTFDRKKADAAEHINEGDHIRGALEKVADKYTNLYCRAATSPEDLRNGILTKIGFQTNKKTKQEMVDWFIPLFEDGEFIDPDERLYHEASIYEHKEDGTYGNKEGRGNHDDILMTDMIGCLVEKDMPPPSFVKFDSEEHYSQGTFNESKMP